MTKDNCMRIEKFYVILNKLHFYKFKGEGLFKFIAITISWCGGVNISNFSENTKFDTLIATSFFLYSLALMMEYCVQLVLEKQLLKKVLPMLMIAPSVLVFIVSAGMLFQRPFVTIPITLTYWCTIIPIIVLGIDVFTQLIIDEPESCFISISTTLRDINAEDENV